MAIALGGRPDDSENGLVSRMHRLFVQEALERQRNFDSGNRVCRASGSPGVGQVPQFT